MNRSARSAEARASFREERADAMRRDPTPAEEAMMSLLVDMGVKFHFQFPTDAGARGEILDFLVWAYPRTLIVEVDGPEHKKGPDERRDRYFKYRHALETIRIKNKAILTEPEKVRAKLMEAFGWH